MSLSTAAAVMVVPPAWQVTPLSAAAVAVALVHAVGRRRVARRQSPSRRRAGARRAVLVYAGLGVVVVASSGPLGQASMTWLSIHMATHVIEMFLVPALLVAGGPWVPLVFALPVRSRRAVLTGWYRGRWTAPLRGLAGAAVHPVGAAVLFNGTMVLWHLPAVYNWASWHGWPMDWLMAPSFVVTGYLFWRVVLASPPWRPRGSSLQQIAVVVGTAFEMLVLSVALAVLARTPVYSMHVQMDGPAAALRDQRLGAGVLWVCGDLWAVPAAVLVAYRIYTGGWRWSATSAPPAGSS